VRSLGDGASRYDRETERHDHESVPVAASWWISICHKRRLTAPGARGKSRFKAESVAFDARGRVPGLPRGLGVRVRVK